MQDADVAATHTRCRLGVPATLPPLSPLHRAFFMVCRHRRARRNQYGNAMRNSSLSFPGSIADVSKGGWKAAAADEYIYWH